MKTQKKDKDKRDGLTSSQLLRETTTSLEDHLQRRLRMSQVFQRMPPKLNSWSILELRLLLEEPEVLPVSQRNSRLQMITVTEHSTRKSSRRLCTTSESVSTITKLDKLSTSLIEMEVEKSHTMSSSDLSEVQ